MNAVANEGGGPLCAFDKASLREEERGRRKQREKKRTLSMGRGGRGTAVTFVYSIFFFFGGVQLWR